MKCKFCGEKDKSKLIDRVSAIRGEIVDSVVVCFKCLGKLLPCPKKENN